MAASLSFSLTLCSDPHHHGITSSVFSSPTAKFPLLHLHIPPRLSFRSFSSPTSPSTTTTTTTTTASAIYTSLEDSFKTGKFLTNEELNSLKTLQDFSFHRKLATGSIWVRVMRQEEVDATVKLLSESFGESMMLPSGYLFLLKFLVKQYLTERREVLPHAVTLVAFYKGEGEGEGDEEELAGTVEVYLNRKAYNASPPSPTPPKDCPYICNMTVKEPLRRRGIGWNLLKAGEELISQMSCVGEVYLHCRMIDSAPFNMYTKAGYTVVKTDSILALLLLQRRKYLMRKELAAHESPKLEISSSNVELPS